MKVSVCIPVYNMAHWLGAAVESVLAQTFNDLEVLIFDDGSSDNPRAAVPDDPRIRWLGSEKNEGGGRAFEKMIAEAQGEYIVPFAADDLLAPNYLERSLAVFDRAKENGARLLMVACWPSFIDAAGNAYLNKQDARMHIPFAKNMQRAQWLETLRRGNLYFGVGMYPKATFAEIGYFDNALEWLSDWDYYIRLVKAGEIAIIEEPLCKYRLHDKALSLITPDKLVRQAKYSRVIRRRHFAPTQRKVIIATPFYMSQCFSQYKSSIVMTTNYLSQAGIPWDIMDLNGDSYVDRAKNTLVARFLESDGTDYLQIDSDLSWTPDAVRRILSYPDGVVSGAFPMKNKYNVFTAWPILGPDGQTPLGRDLGDGTALIQVSRVSGGFLLVKRDVFERFADHYEDMIYCDGSADPNNPSRIYTCFYECDREGFIRWGEDMSFSRKLDAMGIKMWVDPNISFGHYGVEGHFGNYHNTLTETGNQVRALKAKETQPEATPQKATA